MGGLSSICFVPKSIATPENMDEDGGNKIKVNITNTMQKSFQVFKEGGTKAVIQLICRHESIIADHKLEESYNSAPSLINEKNAIYIYNLGRSQEGKKVELEAAISKLKPTCKSTQ